MAGMRHNTQLKETLGTVEVFSFGPVCLLLCVLLARIAHGKHLSSSLLSHCVVVLASLSMLQDVHFDY